jgi:signal transduction protein with GAF and PtsI domain
MRGTDMPPKVEKSELSSLDEIKIFKKVADMVSAPLELEWVLKAVVRIIHSVTQSDSIFIYLIDEREQMVILRASKVPHKKELGVIRLKIGEGLTGWVAQESQPLVIAREAYKNEHFKSFDVLPEDRYEAFLSVPLVFKGKPIGVINVQDQAQRVYPKKVIDLIVTIGKIVGGAIENARLSQDTKLKILEFETLSKVSKSIISEKYLDEILNLIVVLTAEMLNSKICSIMLLDAKRNELEIKATQSMSEEYKKKPNIKVDNSINGEVVKTSKAIAVYDVRKEKKYAYRDLAMKEELTSMLSVPMIVKGGVIGVISVYTKKFHVFSSEEIDALQIVANQAAVAVENTKWMEEALKAKEALETRKLIERAKGALMRLSGLSEEAAYKLIHKKSMDSCKSMKEISESILLMDEFQKKSIPQS